MDKAMLAVILVLDDFSRSRMKVNVAELVMHDVKIVETLRKITPAMLDKTKTVVILEDFVRKHNAFSDLKLYKEVFGLEYLYLGTDDLLLTAMADLGKTFRMNPVNLDYDMMFSVLYGDHGLQSKYLVSEYTTSSTDKFARLLMGNPDYPEDVRKLAESYIALSQMEYSHFREIKSLSQLLEKFQLLLNRESNEKNILQQHYLELLDNAKTLNRTLKQFEPILSKDVYEKISLSRYTKRPSIIYLKEYQELQHLESFIDTLFQMLRYQYKHSVKVLRLHDSSSSKRLLTLSDKKYFKLKNRFLNSEVVSNDYIVKVGNYRTVLDLLLTNNNGLDILIIVDCKDHDDVVLSGQFLQLSMCRNSKYLPVFSLDPASTIVNNEKGNPLSWDTYPEYSVLTGSDKFMFLCSRPVMQTIYELHKGYAQAGVMV